MKPPSAKLIKQIMGAGIAHGIDHNEVSNFIFYVCMMTDAVKALKKAATNPPKGWGHARDRFWYSHALEKSVERLVKLIT